MFFTKLTSHENFICENNDHKCTPYMWSFWWNAKILSRNSWILSKHENLELYNITKFWETSHTITKTGYYYYYYTETTLYL